jgi:hypothetical protein
MKSPRVEYCESIKSLHRPKLLNEFLKLSNASVPGLIHFCPYDGISIFNGTINQSAAPQIFPSGTYKFEFQISLKENEEPKIVITLILVVKSSDRESFGK